MAGTARGQGVRDHRRGERHRRRVRAALRGGGSAGRRRRPGRRCGGRPRARGRRHRRGAGARDVRGARKEQFGRIDVLFNNAGINPTDDESVLDTSVEAWQRVQDVNVRSVFLCCKHGIPHLLDAGGGSVINTASFVAVMGAAVSQISYTASKGAVLVDVAGDGRRVRAARSARERPLPRAREHAAAAGAVRQGPREGRAAPGAPADGAVRGGAARSPRRRCSSPATSRPT